MVWIEDAGTCGLAKLALTRQLNELNSVCWFVDLQLPSRYREKWALAIAFSMCVQ